MAEPVGIKDSDSRLNQARAILSSKHNRTVFDKIPISFDIYK